MHDRIRHAGLLEKRMSVEVAAVLIKPGMTVAMSGFTGAGYPKAVPRQWPCRWKKCTLRANHWRSRCSPVLAGASTAPELDGVLARVGGMELRLPYMSGPALRKRNIDGELDYTDIHLSHVAQHTWFGYYVASSSPSTRLWGFVRTAA